MKRALGHWSAVWAGLLLLRLASPGLTERIGQSEGERDDFPLLFFTVEIYERDALSRTSRGLGEDISGSGSGDDVITPSTTSVPETLLVYIEITLRISLDGYLQRQYAINADVLRVLREFLPEFTTKLTTKRAVSEEYDIVLTVDTEKSSNDSSVLKVHIVNSETGEQDVEATEQAFNRLASESAKFVYELERTTNIKVVDVKFIDVSSTESQPITSTSLNWWDILFIVLGCTAVAMCPILVISAVSFEL